MTIYRAILNCSAAAMVFAIPAVAHADVTIGPRFSYYVDNSNLRSSNVDGLRDDLRVVDDQVAADLTAALSPAQVTLTETDNGRATNAEEVTFPMFGALINFGDDRDRFTIMGMYGKGTTRNELLSTRELTLMVDTATFNEISVIETITDDEIERFDIELTWQRRLNEELAILGGVRYERLNKTGSGRVSITDTDEVRQFISTTLGTTGNGGGFGAPQRIGTISNLETYSARLGVTAFVPASQNTVLFFSGMVQGGYQPATPVDTQFFDRDGLVVREEARQDRSEFSAGPDFAVGAQFMVSDDIALDVRYRAIVSFPLSGEFSFSDARVNHGVNLGVSLRL